MTSNTNTSKNSLPILGIIFAILGLGISIYALQHHLEVKESGHTQALCNINDTFSCDDVAKSEFSEDPWGNPLGLYGISYFLGLLLLLVAAMVKEEYRKDTLPTYAVMCGLGVLVSVVLFSISKFKVGALCLSCIGVYTVTLIQALVAVFLRKELPKPWSVKGIYNGGFYMLLALLACLAAFQILKPMPQGNFTPDIPKSAEEVQNILTNMDLPPIKVDRSQYSGLGEDYRKGSDDAKVTIVEFADFQCPSCQRASQTLRMLKEEFGDQILVVFKNYPLDSSCNKNVSSSYHKLACKSAVLARCAGQYGKFWEMHDKIFENQSKIDDNRLELWLRDLGISKSQQDVCLASQDILNKIKADIDQGTQLNITGTPAIFINSMPVASRTYDALRSEILARLNR